METCPGWPKCHKAPKPTGLSKVLWGLPQGMSPSAPTYCQPPLPQPPPWAPPARLPTFSLPSDGTQKHLPLLASSLLPGPLSPPSSCLFTAQGPREQSVPRTPPLHPSLCCTVASYAISTQQMQHKPRNCLHPLAASVAAPPPWQKPLGPRHTPARWLPTHLQAL